MLANDSILPDIGESLTITGVSAPNLIGLLALANDRMSLRYRPIANFVGEDSATYQVSDGRGGTGEATVTINVINTNDPPTNITLSGTTISENVTGGVIGTLSVIDVDPGDAHTITVPDARFEVSQSMLKLKTNKSLDFEASDIVTVFITAKDDAGESVTVAHDIHVQDVNEQPELTNPLIDQTAAANFSFEYTIPSNSFSDPDANDSLTYTATLVDGSPLPSWLHFDATDRRFSGDPLDSDLATHDIKVVATDSGNPELMASDDFQLEVVENPTPFHNVDNPLNVNNDITVSPVDALLIINYLNDSASGSELPSWEPPPYLDSSGDNRISPVDGLMVINHLNSSPVLEGESAPREVVGFYVSDEVRIESNLVDVIGASAEESPAAVEFGHRFTLAADRCNALGRPR